MNLALKTTALGSVLFLLALMFYSFSFNAKLAGATAGFLPATVATTSQATISTTAQLVFATSTCVSRTISTGASAIMIGFGENQGFVPTGVIGHSQAASTTVTYDGGQFGCGAVRIYSYASQILTVMESR